MDRKDFAFDRVNLILLAIGMAIVVIGFLLMSGGGSTAEQYNPEIFSAVRIKVAPVVCFLGFISMIYAVMRKPKDEGVKEKGEGVKDYGLVRYCYYCHCRGTDRVPSGIFDGPYDHHTEPVGCGA